MTRQRAERSTGTTTTYLFTDIEASTTEWETSADMPARLERHLTILEDAVTEFGGTVFATMGDGIAAAFPSAQAAVHAAAAAQQALPVSGLRSRMGLHTGEAQRVGSDHRGRAVNRAARIMAMGDGGQILLSDVSASIVRGGPTPVDLVDLGTHHLRGLREPERLWQVSTGPTPTRESDPTMRHLPSGLRRLHDLAPFASCTTAELRFLADRLCDHHAAPGAVLAAEGTTGREWVVIATGSAVVLVGDEEVARLGPGDSFGEIALLDHGPRTATVVADTAVVALVANVTEFRQILDQVPTVAREVLVSMATRLRTADARLANVPSAA